MLKNTIKLMVIASVLFLGLPTVASSYETHYSKSGVIINVDENKVSVQDSLGNVWVFNGTGFNTGDRVKMTLFNNGTESIKDDKVTNIKKF